MKVGEQDFLAFVASILEVPAAGLSLDTAYNVFPAWDSVMHLRLTLEIERRYALEIPLDEISKITTLRDFYARVGDL